MVNPLTTHARLGLLFLLNRFSNDIAGWMDPEVDVFHTCKLLNPPRRAKLTATVHDLTCWILPETHSPANVAAENRFAERIVKRADGLIAVSEATRDDAVRILKVPPEKIQVIHHGVAEPFFNVTKADAEAVRLRYGLRRPYVLFVGTIGPEEECGPSVGCLPGFTGGDTRGVRVGGVGSFRLGSGQHLGTPAADPPGVRYLGYVSEADLPGLFAGATLFVYPSLYEGFGFPVAQAMAAGVAVVTSGVS